MKVFQYSLKKAKYLLFFRAICLLLVSIILLSPQIISAQENESLKKGIIVEKDVKVEITDKKYIMIDIFRPDDEDEHPTIIGYGPYSKDSHMQDVDPAIYKMIKNKHKHLHLYTVDPLWWSSQGYVVITADQIGTGKSPGRLSFQSKDIGEDYAKLIRWAAQRPWSNGNIGLIGISQYAANQLHAATYQPAGLKAMILWQVYSDIYRDLSRHGGILSNTFLENWFKNTMYPNMSEANRNESVFLDSDNLIQQFIEVKLFGKSYLAHDSNFNRVNVPVLSVGFWDDVGLYLRGNIEAFTSANTRNKFLRIMYGDGNALFYREDMQKLQKEFFDFWLTNKYENAPDSMRYAVSLEVRDDNGSTFLHSEQWPLPNTMWKQWYLNAQNNSIQNDPPEDNGTTSFSTLPDSQFSHVHFISEPVKEKTAIVGPIKLNLWLSVLHTDDADIFASLRIMDYDKNIKYQKHFALPKTPLTIGWLRVSHRELDLYKSDFWRPYHKHTQSFPVSSHSVFNMEIEIWPSSFVLEPGDRLYLEIGGQDPADAKYKHNHSKDREQRGVVRVHTGKNLESYILLPIIPLEGKEDYLEEKLDFYRP